MSGGKNKRNMTMDPPQGCFFADPSMLPGDYVPAKKVLFREAVEYAKKIKEQENRDVTFEEMQKFAVR